MDTHRTLTQLLTALADNTNGDITPQVMRDLVITTFANYGSIRVVSSHSETIIASTAEKYTDWDQAGPSNACTVDVASTYRITVPADGAYRVALTVSLNSITSAGTLTWQVRKNASVSAEGALEGKVNSAAVACCVACEDILNLVAGDYLEVWVTSTNSGSFSVGKAALSVARIG